MCQEMSQFAPTVADVTASTAHHIYQGIGFSLLEVRLASDTLDLEVAALAIKLLTGAYVLIMFRV
jgi:hypothetical protein